MKREVRGEGWKEFVCAIIEQAMHDLHFALTIPSGRKLDQKDYFTPLHFELFFDQVDGLVESANLKIPLSLLRKKAQIKIDKLRKKRDRIRQKLYVPMSKKA